MSDFRICDNCKDKYHSSKEIGTKEPATPPKDPLEDPLEELIKELIEELIEEFVGIVRHYFYEYPYNIDKDVRTFANKVRAIDKGSN